MGKTLRPYFRVRMPRNLQQLAEIRLEGRDRLADFRPKAFFGCLHGAHWVARSALDRFAACVPITRKGSATLSPVGYRLRFIPLRPFGPCPPWVRGTRDRRSKIKINRV